MTGRWQAEVERFRPLGEQDEVPDSFVPFALADDDKSPDSETEVKCETVDFQSGRPPLYYDDVHNSARNSNNRTVSGMPHSIQGQTTRQRNKLWALFGS